MAERERRHIHFSGRVQGVGFRYTTRSIAARFAVTGFVRNLSDGRVELVADGASAELAAFLAEIQRQMEGYIDSMQQDRRPVDDPFEGFEIRF